MAPNGPRTKALPFKPPPPPPADGSPPYLLKIQGFKAQPFRDLIVCLRHLRHLRATLCPCPPAKVIRVVDKVVLAFTVSSGQPVKDAANNAHAHRPNKKQMGKKSHD